MTETPPHHPDVVLWRTATPDDIDAIHAVSAAADAVDHPSWITPREDVADTFDLPHIDHSRDTILAFGADGAPIAFGNAALHPAREGTLTVHLDGGVRPDVRGRGIGRLVLDWQRARGRQQVAQALVEQPDAASDRAELKLYAEETNAAHQALAVRAGMAAQRWFATMERTMGGARPTPPLAAGFTVAEYTHASDEEMRLARNDAFRDHWGSLPSQPEGWAKFVGGEFFRPDLSRLVRDADGAIAAFCLASVNEDDWVSLGASHAYIDLIGVVRDHRRKGLAPAVIAASLAAIETAGLERAVLDVDTASPTGANTLYEGLGFAATERSVAFVENVSAGTGV